MRASLASSALVAVLVGFGGSVAIVLAAAEALGATPAQAGSWVAALCVSMAATSVILSAVHRMPIVTAWSTPGAALVAAGSGVSMAEAVGAFLVCAALLLATAWARPLGRLAARMPAPIATAVLAGVLFPFVAALPGAIVAQPALGAPMALLFVVLRGVSPVAAVLTPLALGIGLSHALSDAVGFSEALPPVALSQFVWIAPHFDVAAMIGLGLPLYMVTMASQNLPGFAVLRAAGYAPPTGSALTVTGLASAATAPFGGHTTSIAAITASLCVGPDTHPDPARRWICGVFYGLGYAGLALVAGSAAALFAAYPPELIVLVAGLALAGPFAQALAASFRADGSAGPVSSGPSSAAPPPAAPLPADPLPAMTAFAVTAAGVPIFGLGAAFWGLLAGLALHGLARAARRPAKALSPSPAHPPQHPPS